MVKTFILLGLGVFGLDSGLDSLSFCLPFCSADEWDFWEQTELALEQDGDELVEVEELEELEEVGLDWEDFLAGVCRWPFCILKTLQLLN